MPKYYLILGTIIALLTLTALIASIQIYQDNQKILNFFTPAPSVTNLNTSSPKAPPVKI